MGLDFKELASIALANASKVLAHFLPDGKTEGAEYVAKNPTRGDASPGSFKVNVSSGLWSDFATGDSGNDLISLVAYLQQSTMGEAAKVLADLLGLDRQQQQKSRVTGSWIYHDEHGSPVLKVDRVEPGKNGRKKDFWQYHRDRGEWRPGAKGNFVLYRLPEVITARLVILVEGERKADVVRGFGFCATCIPGGAKEKFSGAIERELSRLTGKDLCILPDNDDVGRAYARSVATFLHGKAASIKIINLTGLEAKGDVVDWSAIPGNDADTFKAIIEAGELFSLGHVGEFESSETLPATGNGSKREKRPRTNDVALELMALAEPLRLLADNNGQNWVHLNSELIPISSLKFSRWLTHQHYELHRVIPGAEAISMATRALEAKATYEAPTVAMFNRLAWGPDGEIFYDLGNGRTATIIPGRGFEVIDSPPMFRSWMHQQPHPDPTPNGDPWRFLNYCRVAESGIIGVLTALITAFIPGVAQPLWHIQGPEGSGKSSFTRLIKRTIDPSAAELQLMSTEKEGDFFLTLSQNYVVPFDNVSGISTRTSDILCMAATGAAVSQRLLYSNTESVLLHLKNLILLNGISPDLINRADLRDRTLVIPLDRIPSGERQEDRRLMAQFDDELPAILGGIFSILSKALEIYPTVHLDNLPRLADWAKYAYSVAEALGGYGARFLEDYANNRDEQRKEFLNTNSLASALISYMEDRDIWETTVGEAWSTLFDVAFPPDPDSPNRSRDQRKPKSDMTFPGKPQDMRRYLERLKVTLSESNITSSFKARTREGVPVVFTRLNKLGIGESGEGVAFDPKTMVIPF